MNIINLLRRVRDILASDRKSLFEAECLRDGNVPDPEARRLLGEYDDILGELNAAIQQMGHD